MWIATMGSEQTEFKPGQIVEGFRVMAELGRGARSIVYLVQNPETKEVWALKHVEKIGPKDDRFIEQAEMEAKIAGGLDHPAIRKIHRVIKKKARFLSVKELFLVMELVDGVSIDIQPPRTFEQAVHIFHQTASAMAHMHMRGYAHADMKPNNVVVDDKGTVKIIDLGQACKIGTVKPRIQGTPDYIAPEQVHLKPITAKTDIYNLGAMMYWVLTRRYIPTALPKGDSLVSSLDPHLMAKPMPAIEINRKVPPKLNELIMQCVEIVPEDRPADMMTVADRLNLIHGILLARQGLSDSKFNVDPPTDA
ncbi:MAG: serine/threonine protein kinase [Phycisphaeraceae bacterium]|nr:serine/threonine protein kinase [Phycisphaerae bacterium]MBX3391719.1 serine/threonine protein kinase [Phycisphaeraceae bacterium]